MDFLAQSINNSILMSTASYDQKSMTEKMAWSLHAAPIGVWNWLSDWTFWVNFNQYISNTRFQNFQIQQK